LLLKPLREACCGVPLNSLRQHCRLRLAKLLPFTPEPRLKFWPRSPSLRAKEVPPGTTVESTTRW